MALSPAVFSLAGSVAAPLVARAVSQTGQALRQGAASFAEILAVDEKGLSNRSAAVPKSTPDPGLSPAENSLSEVRADVAVALTSIHGRLKQQLSQRGHDLFTPFELQIDEGGTVRVAGDHPLANEIDDILAQDDELANEVRRVAANTGLLKAAERRQRFAAECAIDPQHASRLLREWQTEDAASDFRIRVTRDGAEPAFFG